MKTQSYQIEDEKTRTDPLLHAFSPENRTRTLEDGSKETYQVCFHCNGSRSEHRQAVDCSTSIRQVVPIS